VITGFNTDIEHEGTVYHVQTEDKGLDTPIILSLVYVGGTILASKRSPYADLIEQGFSDEALAERLKRQHKLICAAINSGRIDDLKKMSRPAKGTAAQETVATEAVATEEVVTEEIEEVTAGAEEVVAEEVDAGEVEAPPPAFEEFEFEYGPITQEWAPPPPRVEEPVEEVVEEEIPAEPEPVAADAAEELPIEEPLPDGLLISLLDDEEFYSGEKYTLRVLISNRTNGEDVPLQNVAVSIKILGTTFRPLIYALKTERDGVASVATQIPEFNSGRAAVLVRAVAKDQAAELRRIIHPVK
jgi:hypothetical protein